MGEIVHSLVLNEEYSFAITGADPSRLHLKKEVLGCFSG
ncbi:hypothetical protein HBHAL_2344 [Halobacillus halophilus DSM 2266]|uniref:Uncharacterized protein n=1 Tax=Halobacillus halophilus (strain ATCC 35676 / DSM 2266 / JCM 20832 / KCTC 3685 / LMG 17431 / NBRC 102448 / NCIMB 2269) TaxID=866895 RepID=I0JKM1_HALH3|nr:hypothetical protein HBHAL_2344 [Halobacillus halophilus DSM 2266]